MYPKHMFLEPTIRCNLRCVMCGTTYWNRPPKKDMSLELFKRILGQAKGLESITIQGAGEPLFHRDIIEMIEFARGLGLNTRFNSNMTIMSREMAERLVRAGHGEITVSIDSLDPDRFADIRRGARLEDVLANVREVNEAKKRLGKDNPQITVTAVVTRSLLADLPGFVAGIKGLGARMLTLSDMNTDGLDLTAPMADGSTLEQQTLRSVPEHKISRAFDEAMRLQDDDFRILVPGGDSGGFKTCTNKSDGILTCAELWECPFVTADGFVTPCCWLPDQSLLCVGDFNTMTFEEIWFGKAYQELRRQHMTGHPPAHCATCQQRFFTFEPPSRLLGKATVQRSYTKCFVQNHPRP